MFPMEPSPCLVGQGLESRRNIIFAQLFSKILLSPKCMCKCNMFSKFAQKIKLHFCGNFFVEIQRLFLSEL